MNISFLFRKKERLEKKNNGKDVAEELLFHGTKHDAMDAICQQNFDWRLSGTRVGSLYGQGKGILHLWGCRYKEGV